MGVITISKRYGAGGEEVAERVAEKFGYRIVDREEIQKKLIEITDEGTAEKVSAEKSPGIIDRVIGDIRVSKSLLIESILSFAENGSVILMGRGSFDILKDVPGTLHILLTDTLEKRAARISLQQGIKEIDAREKITRFDRESAGFVKSYFGKEWPDPSSYHLSMTPFSIGIDTCTKVILNLAEMMDMDPSFEREGRNIIRKKHLLAALTNRIVLNAGTDIGVFELAFVDDKTIGITFSRALGVKFSHIPADLREKAIKVASDFTKDYAVVQVK